MSIIKENSIVIAYLETPKERYFGVILKLHPSGLIIRGLNVESFNTWIIEVNGGKKGTAISTFFFPWRRVEKIILDEDRDGAESLACTFKKRTGKDVEEFLLP
ncbi:MAG: hypothetical protein J7L62_00430 [Candidatus Aminicenantes bacterium]|nr:hypothetical protein [Candidatus Aminicenantes bacterium]